MNRHPELEEAQSCRRVQTSYSAPGAKLVHLCLLEVSSALGCVAPHMGILVLALCSVVAAVYIVRLRIWGSGRECSC
jgi:hypothetical protein